MRGTLYTKERIDDYINKGYWENTSRADLVDRNGREFSNREALVDARQRLKWSELSQKSDKLAFGLLRVGFKREDVVLAQLPNWAELYILQIACEKAGIILTSVQPTFRHAELQPILIHIAAKGVIIPSAYRHFDYLEMAKRLQSEIPSIKEILVLGDRMRPGTTSFEGLMEGNPEENFPPGYLAQTRFDPFEVANIVTTSGSTGLPKCIEYPVCFRVCAGRHMARRWEITEKDVIGVCIHLMGGGARVLTQFANLVTGAKVILIDHFEPQTACEIFESEKITIMCTVPALLVRLLDYKYLDKYDFSSLRLIHSAASLLPYDLGVKAEDRLGARCVQSYGTTEVGHPLCTYSIEDPREVRLRTVGRPYFEGTFKIVDEKGQEVPQGEPGEIVVDINGPCSASGYYKNEKLNMEDFRSGLFFTGNDGRFDEYGNVIVFGRKRETIIRGGQNIFPGEIENLLIEHPKVGEVAVVRMPDRIMGEKACAYIVPGKGQEIDFEEIIAFLRDKKLAPFKLPERMEILTELPKAPAGDKVDKVKLEEDIARKLEEENRSVS